MLDTQIKVGSYIFTVVCVCVCVNYLAMQTPRVAVSLVLTLHSTVAVMLVWGRFSVGRV